MDIINIDKDIQDFEYAQKVLPQDDSKIFHAFNPSKSKSPSKKKLGKQRSVDFADGLYIYSKEKGLYYTSCSEETGQLVCSHVPYMLENCYNYNFDGSMETSILWGIYDKGADDLRSGMNEMQSDKYLSAHLPVNVIVKSPKLFRQFLQTQSKYVPSVYNYRYTGFIPDKYDYVHSGGIISTRNRQSSHSDFSDGSTLTLRHYNICPDAIVKNLNRIIRLSPVMSLMLSFNLLSLTYSKFSSKRPQFVFLTYGESGTFKSTLSNYIFGIFEETYDQAPINLKIATLPSIHNMSLHYRDCVVVNDDCAPSPDGNEEMCRKAESISRAYGDGTGRTVMKSTTSFHNTKPVGLSAITAEFQPLRDTSDVSRSILFELKKGDITSKDLSKIQKDKSAYVRFVTDYIGWICKLKDNYMKELNEYFVKGRKKYANLSDTHPRLPENFGWLYAGFKMFLRFAKQQYCVDCTLIDEWKSLFNNAINKAICTQKYHMKKVNEAKLFISTVRRMYQLKKIDIAEIHYENHNKQVAQVQNNNIGYYDKKYVYLTFDEAYAITDMWLNNIGKHYSLPADALKTKLINNNFAIKPERGRKMSKVMVNGVRIQVLKFKREVFKIF